MTSKEIKRCNSIPMLRDRIRWIEAHVVASDKPENLLRNEAVRILQRLVELGC
jgi:hypothetical protein